MKGLIMMGFISRHTPTEQQVLLAAEEGFELVHLGDADAFTVGPGFVHDKGPFEAVAVVHPAAALNLIPHFIVGVFENTNRSPVGAPPKFEAARLHVWQEME